MRAVSLAAAAALIAATIASLTTAPRSAIACSLAPEEIERTAREATFIGIVRAVEVGGAENEYPTLTPTVTPTPEPPSPTSSPFPDATPTATFAPPPPIPGQVVSLQGIGARLEIIEPLFGSPPAPPLVDFTDRERVAKWNRFQETNPGVVASCPIDILVERYEQGATYLVMVAVDVFAGVHTSCQFALDGADVVLGEHGGIGMRRSTYELFFGGYPTSAPVESWYDDQQLVYLTAKRVPAANVIAAIRYARTGELPPQPPADDPPTVRPPSTGNAGLAATR